ncbi:MAG: lipoyl domain-containing protein [Pyrinomonadaceae bacterium]
MPTNVDVPPLGESVREAVLIKWHKSDGDTVTDQEPVAELETDKANVDDEWFEIPELPRLAGVGRIVPAVLPRVGDQRHADLPHVARTSDIATLPPGGGNGGNEDGDQHADDADDDEELDERESRVKTGIGTRRLVA